MLTAGELAQRVGCDEARISELVAARYLVPRDGGFDLGDVQRVRLADAFEEAGIAVEAIVRGIEAGVIDYTNAEALVAAPASLTDTTYAELAARHGREPAYVQRLVRALGLPRPEPGDRLRSDDAAVLPLLLARWDSATDEDQIRFAGIYGDGLRRISDAATALFQSAITQRLLDQELPFEELNRRVGTASGQVLRAAEALVAWLHHRHVETDIFRRSVEGTEEALAAADVRPARPRRPQAIAFLDLTGYTALTEARGDEAAADLAARLGEVVDERAMEHGGRPVKWLGDGVMFHFPEPREAVAAALELVERTPVLGLPPARVGVNAGPVIYRDGDYFGRTVNIAARIADYARPGEVLVTEEVRRGMEDVTFDALHPVSLKGVSEPVPLYRARSV